MLPTAIFCYLWIVPPGLAQTHFASGSDRGFPPFPPASLLLKTPGSLPLARPQMTGDRSPPAALGSPPPASWFHRAFPWWPAPGCGCSPWCCCCAASTTASQTLAGSREEEAQRAAEVLTCCSQGFCGLPAVRLSLLCVCLSISVQILFWGDYVAFHHLYSWKDSRWSASSTRRMFY